MKQLKSSFFLLLAPALLAACAADEQLPAPDEGGSRILTFTASAPQTRTVLQPGDVQGNHPVYWSDGDAIAVFPEYPEYPGGLGSKGTFTTNIPGGTASTAVFTGQSPDPFVERFAAFYPDEAIVGITNSTWLIPFSVPAEQTATPGTFAPHTNPAYASPVSADGNLEFKNIGALVKLSTTGVDDLDKMVMRVDNKWLTGSAFYDAENDRIEFRVDNGHTAYNWAALKGSIVPGQDYYLVVHPFTLTATDRLSLTFVKADGTRTTRSVTPGKELKLEAGRIANLGAIDLGGATFEHIIDNKELIAAVEGNKSMGWTKNDDGTVTVTSDNQSKIAGVTDLSNLYEYNLTSLSGIEYFTNLTSLDFSASSVPFVDVSKLTKLQYLIAQGSEMASLTLGELPQLEMLLCDGCWLTSLDIRNLDNLTTLICGGQRTGRALTLILTAEQKKKWDASWGTDPTNSNVTVVVKEKDE